MWERMDERTLFVDEFQDAASKDGDWLIIGKFTKSVDFLKPCEMTTFYRENIWNKRII
jgi:hypothetical protein